MKTCQTHQNDSFVLIHHQLPLSLVLIQNSLQLVHVHFLFLVKVKEFLCKLCYLKLQVFLSCLCTTVVRLLLHGTKLVIGMQHVRQVFKTIRHFETARKTTQYERTNKKCSASYQKYLQNLFTLNSYLVNLVYDSTVVLWLFATCWSQTFFHLSFSCKAFRSCSLGCWQNLRKHKMHII